MIPHTDPPKARELRFCAECASVRPQFDERLDPVLRKCHCGATGELVALFPPGDAERYLAALERGSEARERDVSRRSILTLTARDVDSWAGPGRRAI